MMESVEVNHSTIAEGLVKKVPFIIDILEPASFVE